MVMVLAPEQVSKAVALLREAGETVYEIGVIEQGDPGEAQAVVV